MPRKHAPSTACASYALPTTDRGGARSRRGVVAAAIAMATLAVSVACGAGAVVPEAPSGGTVVVASGADLESANPLVTVHPMARQVQRFALFVTLARYDSALRPIPYFARRWQWSDDRRALTLALEPTLRWHDGTPTTARDVAFTLEAARDPATASPRAADLAWLARIEVRDDSTLTLRARQPLPELPAILCELPVVPAHRLAGVARADFRRDRFATEPLGNGPFRFVERRAGQRWIFDRNDAFPASMGGPPRVGRMIVAVVDEATTKFAGLVSGDLDLAGIAPTMAPLVSRDPTLAVLTYPVTFSYAMVFNAARAPFDDVRVRRAVSAAIDRGRIVRVALAGYGTPAGGAVPPQHPFALAQAIAADGGRDEATASRLLDDAGWRRAGDGVRRRGGEALRFTLLSVGSGDNALEQLVQGDLRRLGIAMEIRQMELGAFLTEARAKDKRFDALVTGIPGDLSLAHLAGMFDGTLRGGALDYAGFHEATLDTAFARARTAPTVEAARDAWRQVQRELAAQAPVAWLYHARGVQGMRRRLHGVRIDLRGELATLASWSVDANSPPPASTTAAAAAPAVAAAAPAAAAAATRARGGR
ncbi:MAG: peptide ABC transporter substrate-binding protein [Gemmatimonadaceae bacterium]